MAFQTRVYGLSIQCSSIIPGLKYQQSVLGLVDLNIHFHSLPSSLLALRENVWCPHSRFRSRRPVDQGDQPILQITESPDGFFTKLSYRGGLDFIFNSDATHLWVNYPANFVEETAIAILLNPALGFALRMREVVCLHATAIVVDNQVLLVAGKSGAGKSTMASYFALRGHSILSDDVCALQMTASSMLVQPGYPALRLWPQTTEAIFRGELSLPRITPDWEKQYLSLNNEKLRFADRAMPIGVIYALVGRSSDLSISPLSRGEALFTLMNNTYLDYLLDNRLRASDLKALATLVESTPVRIVTAEDDLMSIPRLYSSVRTDFDTWRDSTSRK